jgi:hypothetical protein
MNKENLLKLAEILDEADDLHREADEPGYCQERYMHLCGTPACALGHWAAAYPNRWVWVYGRLYYFDSERYWHPRDGSKLEFGLDTVGFDELFEADGCDDAETAAEAAEYIRGYVARHEGGES